MWKLVMFIPWVDFSMFLFCFWVVLEDIYNVSLFLEFHMLKQVKFPPLPRPKPVESQMLKIKRITAE